MSVATSVVPVAKSRKMRETAPNQGESQIAILNEIIASATEIKCCNQALEGKEIALRACPAADSLMMRPFPLQMPV
ncbi:hypothetical protein ACVW1A_002285 [Bradyrhizobium sp. LB1.3]